jgi:hypothetical protein
MEELNMTSLRFCNDWLNQTGLTSKLHLTGQAGQIKDICVVFFNFNTTWKNFHIAFSEAALTKNKTYVCQQDGTKNKFADLVREDFSSMNILVKPNLQEMRHFHIGIPKSTTGDIVWCMAYRLDNSYSHKTGAVFGMLIRKGAPIFITITGDVYNFWRRDDIKLGVTANRNGVLKTIAGILIIWIIISIIQTTRKKEKKEKKHHKK